MLCSRPPLAYITEESPLHTLIILMMTIMMMLTMLMILLLTAGLRIAQTWAFQSSPLPFLPFPVLRKYSPVQFYLSFSAFSFHRVVFQFKGGSPVELHSKFLDTIWFPPLCANRLNRHRAHSSLLSSASNKQQNKLHQTNWRVSSMPLTRNPYIHRTFVCFLILCSVLTTYIGAYSTSISKEREKTLKLNRDSYGWRLSTLLDGYSHEDYPSANFLEWCWIAIMTCVVQWNLKSAFIFDIHQHQNTLSSSPYHPMHLSLVVWWLQLKIVSKKNWTPSTIHHLIYISSSFLLFTFPWDLIPPFWSTYSQV
jgi:hypothetical protein